MSRKIRFEDDKHNSHHVNATSATADYTNTSKRKSQRKLYHGDTASEKADKTVQTSAAASEPTGAALAPSGDSPSFIDGAAGLPNIAGLQHGTANFMRNIPLDETPDRNTAVSTVRFGLELGATSISKMAANQKAKRKSKLKDKDSSLKFGQDEAKGENTEAQENHDSQTQGSGEAGQSDNGGAGEAGDGTDSINRQGNDNDTANDSTANSKDGSKSNNDAKPNNKQPKPDADTTGDSGTAQPSGASDEKTDSRLKFAKEEKAIAKLEKRADKLGKKLEKAKDKIPAKKEKQKQLVFDEEKGKTVSKLTHEKEKIPIGEAKWNKPKDKTLPLKAAGVAASMTVTNIHAKVHQVEHENVGVKLAHKAELMAESGYRGTKRKANSAYRFHKNRPYRRVAKLEQKSIKNKMKLDYKKALRDNPKLKSNPLSRFMQKRAIKRNYAKDLKAAKNAAQTGKKAIGFTAKAAKMVTALIRKNPVFLVKAGLLLLIVFLILSMFSMCMGIFSGTSSFVGAVSYSAEFEDIDDASILMTDLETDLRIYINEIEENYPDYDEYRFNIDSIGHDPFALMAFLTAVYHDFTFSQVEATIRAVFEEQYTLVLESEVEIRTRIEQRTGTGTGTGTGSYVDEDGNTQTYTYSYSYSYTYYVEVEYEWHILNVTLTSRSFTGVLLEMMDDDQTEHFNVLMQSKGARQFVGNPFDFDWRPFVTSLYGYRVHPISGERQFHWGLDIGLPEGTPLRAGLDGVVVAVGYDADGYGNFVVVECSDGSQVRFAHCHEVFVLAGQEVASDDVIATVGNTGASTGAHLHIEVSRDGRRLNPIFFLSFH